MLTADQKSQRRNKLTASAVKVLMEGDPVAIHRLWLSLVGDPSYVDEDLSGVWPVRLGETTEALHLEWVARKHGPVVRQGEVCTHYNGWAACTLDGWLADQDAPVEVKHVNGRSKREVVIQRYLPQMTWIMSVTGKRRILFSVIEGASEPASEFIEFNDSYNTELWQRAESFWRHVQNLAPPVELPPIAPPVLAVKEVNMSQSNSWVSNAATWSLNKTAAKDFDTAAKALREAVPADAYRCYGGGIEAKRDRAGRLTIKETK